MGQGARWEHVRELGEGGMGRVSLARRTLLDGVTQRVVVKRAHGGDEAASRLRAEARALACIDHGNVVKLLDAGEDAEGPFLVLEHVDGVDAHALLEDALEELLEDLRARAGRARAMVPRTLTCQLDDATRRDAMGMLQHALSALGKTRLMTAASSRIATSSS